MSNITNIKQKEEKQYASGEAFCLNCKSEWIAVVPTGATQLKCPECNAMKGLLRFPFSVQEGELLRECNCGNTYFQLTPEGHLCPNCGNYQTYE